MSVLAAPENVETMHPIEIFRWAFRTYGIDNVVTTASFEDPIIAHLAWSANPDADIVLLDTQYLFAETLWLVDEMRRRFGIRVRTVRPQADVRPDNLWQTDTDACCALRKVEPLQRALDGKSVWATGLQRSDSISRSRTPVVSYDLNRTIVKLNPIAAWTDDDVALYASINDLPANPLSERGYPSIGCWPCTRPVSAGDDKRAGRWGGVKVECGLHA